MIIHRFWMGRQIPEAYVEYGKKWFDLNPDHEVAEWREGDIDVLLEHAPEPLRQVVEDIYERDAGRNGIEMSVQIADVLGYVLVEQYGGIYVNCDMEPIAPLPMLPEGAWASYENLTDGRVNNAAIGAGNPHDGFWRALLAALPENYYARRLDEMVMSTGPGFLTEFHERTPGLTVLPMTVFNSIHWSRVLSGGNAAAFVKSAAFAPETIAVHHWGHKRDGRTNTVENATQG